MRPREPLRCSFRGSSVRSALSVPQRLLGGLVGRRADGNGLPSPQGAAGRTGFEKGSATVLRRRANGVGESSRTPHALWPAPCRRQHVVTDLVGAGRRVEDTGRAGLAGLRVCTAGWLKESASRVVLRRVVSLAVSPKAQPVRRGPIRLLNC